MRPVLGLFRSNAWATERVLEFCEGRPEAAAPAERDDSGRRLSTEQLARHLRVDHRPGS